MNFSVSVPLCYAFGASALIPVLLALFARLPGLRGRNALQFSWAVCATLVFWTVALTSTEAAFNRADVATGLMMLGAATLLLLEVWALLSRGYTLGLLLTLHRAPQGLTETELADAYRGGEGLSWIMRHRLAGLRSAGLVRTENDKVVLTPGLGLAVARVYRLAVFALGVRTTG